IQASRPREKNSYPPAKKAPHKPTTKIDAKTAETIRPMRSSRLLLRRMLLRKMRQRRPAISFTCAKTLCDAVTSAKSVPRVAAAPRHPGRRSKERYLRAFAYRLPPARRAAAHRASLVPPGDLCE